MGKLKEQARRVIDELPEDATFDEMLYRLYIDQKIQRGLDAIEKGEVTSHDDVRERFLGESNLDQSSRG